MQAHPLWHEYDPEKLDQLANELISE